MRAVDGGNPPRQSEEARVRVQVTRNKNDPQFEGTEPFEISVNENEGVNNRVYSIRARDADPEGPFQTLKYELIGDDDGPVYFRCDEDTGEIVIIRSLQETNKRIFVVR